MIVPLFFCPMLQTFPCRTRLDGNGNVPWICFSQCKWKLSPLPSAHRRSFRCCCIGAFLCRHFEFTSAFLRLCLAAFCFRRDVACCCSVVLCCREMACSIVIISRVIVPKKKRRRKKKGQRKKSKNAGFQRPVKLLGSSLVVSRSSCGPSVASYPQPPWRTRHGCTVGVDRDRPV